MNTIEREPAFKWVLRNELERIKKYIENPVLMDIGANEGDYVVLMHEIFGDISHRIIAIEADENNFTMLKANVEFNEIPCTAMHCAMGEIRGEVDFHGSTKNNLGSLIPRVGITKYPVKVKGVILEDFPKPDFIKMDIEGGEVFVLRGARNYLKNQKNMSILMEVHPHQYTENISLDKELQFLFDAGWNCKWMISSALPDFLIGYKECSPLKRMEVSPGWDRVIFYAPSKESVLKYACWPNEIGIPTWHGNLSGKLIRGLLLRSKN